MQRCGAVTRGGKPCQAWAMGNGRCRMHGGPSPGRPLVHGRYSLAHRAALADKMAAFLADPQPGDLTAELALMRALLEDYVSRFPDGIALPVKEIARIYEMVEAIGRLVERISRIINQTALTQAEVNLLTAWLADLLVQHVDDPDKRLAILDGLAAALGSGRGDTRPALTPDALG